MARVWYLPACGGLGPLRGCGSRHMCCGCVPAALQAFGLAAEAAKRGAPFNSRACKYPINVLMALCSNPNVAECMDLHAATMLYRTMLLCLIDERLRLLQGDGEHMRRMRHLPVL